MILLVCLKRRHNRHPTAVTIASVFVQHTNTLLNYAQTMKHPVAMVLSLRSFLRKDSELIKRAYDPLRL